MTRLKITEEMERIAELATDGSFHALEQYIGRQLLALKNQLAEQDFLDMLAVGRIQGQIQAFENVIKHVQHCYKQVHMSDKNEKEDANLCQGTKRWKSLLRPRSQRPSQTTYLT